MHLAGKWVAALLLLGFGPWATAAIVVRCNGVYEHASLEPEPLGYALAEQLEIPPELRSHRDIRYIRDAYLARLGPELGGRADRYVPLFTWKEAMAAVRLIREGSFSDGQAPIPLNPNQSAAMTEYLFRKAHGLASNEGPRGHVPESPPEFGGLETNERIKLLDRAILRLERNHSDGVVHALPARLFNASHPPDPNFAPRPVAIFTRGDPLPDSLNLIRQNAQTALAHFNSKGEGNLFIGDWHLNRDPENNRRIEAFNRGLASMSKEGAPLRVTVMGDIFDAVATMDFTRKEKVDGLIQQLKDMLDANPRVRLNVVGGNHDTMRLETERMMPVNDHDSVRVKYTRGRIDPEASLKLQTDDKGRQLLKELLAKPKTKSAEDDTSLIAEAVDRVARERGGRVNLLTQDYDEFSFAGLDEQGNPIFVIHVPPNRGVNLERVINPPNIAEPHSLPLAQIEARFPGRTPTFVYADQHSGYQINSNGYRVIGLGSIATHGGNGAAFDGRFGIEGADGHFHYFRVDPDKPDPLAYDAPFQVNYTEPNPAHFQNAPVTRIRDLPAASLPH